MKSRTRLPSYKALSYLSKDESMKKVLPKKNTTLLPDLQKPYPYDPRNKENNVNLMNVEIDKRKVGSKSLISERQKIKSLLKKENILLPLASKVEVQEVQISKEIPLVNDDSSDSKFEGLSIYYHEIIYHLLKVANLNTKIHPAFMEKQKEIRVEKRQELVSELIMLHEKFKMLPTTLFKAINIIDRYLSENPDLQRKKLELLGLTALFSAAKFEEIYPPSMRHYVEASNHKFLNRDFISMEGLILKQLDFNLCDHTACQFIDTISIQFEFSQKQRLACQYLAQLTLYNSSLSHYQSIEIALGCAILVKPDSEILILNSFDKEGDDRVSECSSLVWKVWRKAMESNPTKRKYSQSIHLQVGKLTNLHPL